MEYCVYFLYILCTYIALYTDTPDMFCVVYSSIWKFIIIIFITLMDLIRTYLGKYIDYCTVDGF